MKTIRLECGCKCTETAWTELCQRHAQEIKELHERAQREHKASQDLEAMAEQARAQ